MKGLVWIGAVLRELRLVPREAHFFWQQVAKIVRIVQVLLAHVVVCQSLPRIDELVLTVDAFEIKDGAARLYHDGLVTTIVDEVLALAVILEFAHLLHSGAS